MKCIALALLLLAASGGAAADVDPSLLPIQAKAQAGDAGAQFALAEAYRTGHGVTADPEAAILWYRRATSQGHVRASEELGFALFAHGERREAIPLIEKAAARGDARAMYVMGTAHFNGDYSNRDWPLAYALTMRAASAGLSAAEKNLDLMGQYLLPTDRAKADQILATLPPVRTVAQREAAGTAKPIMAASQPTVSASSKAAKPAKPVKLASATPSPAEAAPAPTRTVAKGAWKAQLGAFGSADRARAQWSKLAAKVPLLNSYDQHVVPWQSVQRLQAWNIGGRSDADTLCGKVQAAGGQCLAIAP